ncbi:hypothetical protein [Mycoplasma sp. ATU-Cv-703]|uniref:hypothetical protein n=1 Tax=Mycoplasma sp. ATU-Cv-703 TaxID=2498595 RepID=UPI000FDE14EB
MFDKQKKKPFKPIEPEPLSSADELEQAKERARLEREIAAKLKHDLNDYVDHESDLLEQQRTTLTDDDLAKTTQVDVDGVENIQEFIEKNLAPDSKKIKK